MRTLTIFAVALAMLTGCQWTTYTETEVALCDAWGDSLPTISHSDTQQTQEEAKHAHATFRAVCE